VTTTWQARLFAGAPNETDSWFELWERVEASLTLRNNAFLWKTLDAGRPVAVDLVDVDAVRERRTSTGSQLIVRRSGVEYADPEELLHFVGLRWDSCRIAPSPVELERRSLGGMLARAEHERGLWARGGLPGSVVSFPQGVTREQAREWREGFLEQHGGPSRSGRPLVLGGGATFTPIGMSQRDAEFIASAKFSVEEISRIFNVPASLLEGGSHGEAGPLTPEHEQDRWLRYGLGPRLARIEARLKADPHLFAGSRDYPMFDTSGVLRGDLLTEATISHQKVQAGVWTPDEARARDGLPPLPDGLGAIPQIVPVGGSPHGVPVPSSPSAEE
jgi:HK97 family phage portal protein